MSEIDEAIRSAYDNALQDEIVVTIRKGCYSFDSGRTWHKGSPCETLDRIAAAATRHVGAHPALGAPYACRPLYGEPTQEPYKTIAASLRRDPVPAPRGPVDPPLDDPFCPGAADPIREGKLT